MQQVDSLYDKNMICIFCELPYTTKRVRLSKIRAIKRDTDFCTHFAGENPLFYEFNVCPNCGLAYTDGFAAIPKDKKEIINDALAQIEFPYHCRKRSIYDAMKGYKLVVHSARLLGERKLILGNLFLRIAWLYRYQGLWKTEHRFISRSVHMYEQAYQSEKLSSSDQEEAKLLYLMGELHARLGNFENTKVHFSKLFTNKQINPKWKTAARDRWLDIKHQASSLAGEDPDGYSSISASEHYTK